MTSPTACVVTSTGIVAPTFDQILAYLQAQFRAIYGADIIIDNDSQDGQWIGILATAINDANAATIAAYNSFSPSTAVGNGLASNVKINGLTKGQASNSQVNVTLGGQEGTTIDNGVVVDVNDNRWNLPASVTIPLGGITVTATAQQAGAIVAPPGTVTRIGTPTYGWQTVTNATDASPGESVESDAALRRRQAVSVALPSVSVLEGIAGAVETIPGVTDLAVYENDTGSTDSNGVVAHSIALVVRGGDATAIATAIMEKKTPGCGTYGGTTVNVTDDLGVVHPIKFSTPTLKTISVAITLHALAGYDSNIADEIKASVVAYINGLGIGTDVLIIRLVVPASLGGSLDSLTYELVTVEAAISPASPGTSDLAIAFNELAVCDVSHVSIAVV